MSNCVELADAVGVRCPNDRLPPELQHKHVHLVNQRAIPAEVYPPRLVSAILRALRDRLRKDRGVDIHSVEFGIGPHVDEDPLLLDPSILQAEPSDVPEKTY